MKRALYLLLPPFTALFLACSDANEPALRSTIVFDWLRDGNRDIYRASVDRADTLRLTTDPGFLVEGPGIGLLAAAISVWAWRLLRQPSAS